jgi:hypothetical protein
MYYDSYEIYAQTYGPFLLAVKMVDKSMRGFHMNHITCETQTNI